MLLPLKQGLKLLFYCKPVCFKRSCYATSIKTRIETPPEDCQVDTAPGCYATSIKTRIETFLKAVNGLN